MRAIFVGTGMVALGGGGVVLFIELLGAVGPFELMALAGNTEHRNNQYQQGKSFHRATA